LNLGAVPDAVYTAYGDYYRKAVSLAVSADTPAMPSQFHMAIVYRALMKYAGFDAAPEVKQEAIENYKMLMQALERDQLPDVYGPSALA
jgi:hypothetical protein